MKFNFNEQDILNKQYGYVVRTPILEMLIKNVSEIEVDDLPEHISIDKLHFKKKNNVYVPTVEYTNSNGKKAELELTLYEENTEGTTK